MHPLTVITDLPAYTVIFKISPHLNIMFVQYKQSLCIPHVPNSNMLNDKRDFQKISRHSHCLDVPPELRESTQTECTRKSVSPSLWQCVTSHCLSNRVHRHQIIDRLTKSHSTISWCCGWNPDCHKIYRRSAVPPSDSVPGVDQEEKPDLCSLCVSNIAEVSSETKALSLPPRRTYDCSINLLPGAPLPSSCLYYLSQPERLTVEKYNNESLASGIIWP